MHVLNFVVVVVVVVVTDVLDVRSRRSGVTPLQWSTRVRNVNKCGTPNLHPVQISFSFVFVL